MLGFYKGFGSIYVALQNEFQESDALTGKRFLCNSLLSRCSNVDLPFSELPSPSSLKVSVSIKFVSCLVLLKFKL